jgi:Fe-S oxidoreductase
VDVATYKSEFLSHYYEGKIKPLHAYAFGMIDRWSRMGSAMPTISNFLLNNSLTKNLIGIHHKRSLPKYANESFKAWFRKRKAPLQSPAKEKVILWADTFNNYFHPEVAKAAVEVLEYAGFEVIVPIQHLCCGRPLYDYGMLNSAKKYLRKIIRELNPEIREGISIIGLEPSCTAVFKDELTNLFPKDEDAKRLKENVFFFSDFIELKAKGFSFPKLKRKAKLHGHCHQKAIFKIQSDLSVLKKMELDLEELDSGCCGMAGAFGYEKNHYDLSVKCGERKLLPEVRKASDDTLMITNGFSCMEQIKQQTGRQALHLAEVLQISLHQ